MLQVIEGKKINFSKNALVDDVKCGLSREKVNFGSVHTRKVQARWGSIPEFTFVNLISYYQIERRQGSFAFFCKWHFFSPFSEKIVLLKGSTEPLVVFFLQIQVILEKVQFFQQIG